MSRTPLRSRALDLPRIVQKVDRFGMAALLRSFPDQLKVAREIGASLSIPGNSEARFSNILVTGMGGSAIAGDFVRAYLSDRARIPIMMNRDDGIPGFVNRKTLLIAVSYSGDTSETLSSVARGRGRNAKVIAVTSGGELLKTARRYGDLCIQVPSGLPPRMALGYLAIPLLICFAKLRLAPFFSDDEFRETCRLLDKLKSDYGTRNPRKRNLAKQLAAACFRRQPVIYAASQCLEVVALRWREQIEENAKCLASHHVLPEMNHNEIVGWVQPKRLIQNSTAVVLRSRVMKKDLALRLQYTEHVIRRAGGRVLEAAAQGQSRLAKMLSLIYLGDWFSYYLAILHGTDPTSIEVIDELKRKLKSKKK